MKSYLPNKSKVKTETYNLRGVSPGDAVLEVTSG